MSRGGATVRCGRRIRAVCATRLVNDVTHRVPIAQRRAAGQVRCVERRRQRRLHARKLRRVRVPGAALRGAGRPARSLECPLKRRQRRVVYKPV